MHYEIEGFFPPGHAAGDQNPYRAITSLLHARYRLSALAASDARDRVYCMLGLIDSKEAALISADYNLTTAQVYATATYASIKARDNFDILHSWFSMRTPDIEGLPSWSIDFGTDGSVLDLPNTIAGEPYTPSLRWKAPRRGPKLTVDLDQSCRFLTIAAPIVEVIQSTVAFERPESAEGVEKLAHCVFHTGQCAAVRFSETKSTTREQLPPTILDLYEKPHALEQRDIACAHEQFVKKIRDYSDGLTSISYLVQTFGLWNSLTGSACFTDFCEEDLGDYAERKGINWTCYYIQFFDAGPSTVFTTESGLIRVAPSAVVSGDIIILVRSFKPLLTVRKCKDMHTFHKPAYVHGLWAAIFWLAAQP